MKVPVRIIHEMALEAFDFNGERYTVDNTFKLAFKTCPEFRLKTGCWILHFVVSVYFASTFTRGCGTIIRKC